MLVKNLQTHNLVILFITHTYLLKKIKVIELESTYKKWLQKYKMDFAWIRVVTNDSPRWRHGTAIKWVPFTREQLFWQTKGKQQVNIEDKIANLLRG